ncbi:putative peptidase aspartic family [Chondromyces apiculatus DSM 436]|uniref:Putative peptidase aspartic family n=1 Tax=Chondromyces apiculatus DSM 436 TaxID=1192034 RepID=A0A017T0A6_9BACT|nr:putative peptidase aspartic family [Chondromyces apiculatus DSM 436]
MGGAIALLALGAIAFVTHRATTSYEAPFDHGEHTNEIFKLDAALKKEPCDRKKAEQLAGYLLDAGDNRAVIQRAADFLAKCGQNSRLSTLSSQAHQNLGEWEQAARDLTPLVEAEPFNPFHRAFRARAYQQQGNLEAAAADFNQALLLYPKAFDLPTELATVYDKQGKHCEAASVLRQLLFNHAASAPAEALQARIADHEQKGGCATTGAKRAVFRMAQGRDYFQAQVRLGEAGPGEITAPFIIDTGASYVTFTRALADRLGLKLAGAQTVQLRTANGQRTGYLTLLPAVAVEGLEARKVPAVIVDELSPGVDGLLGLSFLTRFELRHANRVLELLVPSTPGAVPNASAAPSAAPSSPSVPPSASAAPAAASPSAAPAAPPPPVPAP